MYVCHCAVVTDGDILESIANGARRVADVARDTGAGRGCGGCVSTMRELVCQAGPCVDRHMDTSIDREGGLAHAAR